MARAREFTSGVTPPPERTEPAWWFVFRGTRLLVRMEPAQASLPHLVKVEDLGLNPLCEHYLGRLDGEPCFAVDAVPHNPNIDQMGK